ncbi:1-aminocyclopropane-1-carboxylate deaminase/D-cysteine desulfhydrase [Sorangium sp. So ce1099]|uniref:1-aminocyclopropane-1-carboxylate deaminase/D-cysteine desulfhydrase n=1 Tax=Sorangium sp. So ce1099 TaxID=3133331 RepID=UPI003F5D59BE
MRDVAALRMIDRIPRLGWVVGPSPVAALPRLAAALGLDFLGIKRDDLCEPRHGGMKMRKLDYLLAAPPLSTAAAWSAAGGIGSGNVAALVVAAERLGRRVHAHLFWTDLSRSVVDNLAFIASGPASVRFYRSRLALAFARPSLFLPLRARDGDGAAIVPLGGTSALGMVGAVRAALELCAQVRAGELPEPGRVYVALGSGGTAAGLAVGLALGGLRSRVVAVAVVERLLASRLRLRALTAELRAFLARAGVAPVPPAAPIDVVHGHLGRGYGSPTPESLAACEALAAEGISLEPVYTGKAMAALMNDARARRLGPVLFWHTARREPLPRPEGFCERLPPELSRRLGAHCGGGSR